MRPVVISDVLAVGEVPTCEQVEILARAGFKSLINNQPDGEVERNLGSAEIEAAGRAHALAYRYIPLASRTPPESELLAFAAALKELPAPIYAFCYSGSRSAAACALLMSREHEAADIIASFADAGFDVSGIKSWLVAERARAGARAGGSNRNGAGNGATTAALAPAGGASADAPLAASYQPIIVLPRAASSGGFAM